MLILMEIIAILRFFFLFFFLLNWPYEKVNSWSDPRAMKNLGCHGTKKETLKNLLVKNCLVDSKVIAQ